MAYHTTKDPKIYHACKNCTVGNNIEKENLAQGIPSGARLCKECQDLQANNRCIPGTPSPAR
jgi:hypothetical protein